MKKLLLTLVLTVFCVSSFALASAKSEYVPFRQYFETQGYQVEWDEYLLVAIAKKDNKEVRLKTSGDYYVLNGVLTKFSKPLKMENDRIMMARADVEAIMKAGDVNADMLKLDYKDFKTLVAFYYNRNFMLYRTEGMPVGGMMEDGAAMEEAPMAKQEETAAISYEEKAKADYSETNNQEQGVDEADFVKVDGEYIYIVNGEQVKIVKAGADLALVQDFKVNDFVPFNLFITDDKLILMGQSHKQIKQLEENGDEVIADYRYESSTAVYVYAKKDFTKEAPELLKKFYVAGDIAQARCIDDYIYIVANEYDYMAVPYFRVNIEEASFKNGIEVLMNTLDVANNQARVDEISYFPQHIDRSVMYTIGINLNDLSKTGIDINAYAGNTGIVYVSQNNLYTAEEGYWDSDNQGKTELCKYQLKDGKITYLAKSMVDGVLRNQFSMGEYQDNLRVATTVYDQVTGVSSNGLYIFDKEMNLSGSVTDLAKGERIYSARMMGDKIYMVTFKETDPFYVIDAKNPKEPKVLGYLKLPGFSEYLHPYDENTIIGVGNNTHIEGDGRVIVDGVKIALFDVSDYSNPTLKAEVLAGGDNSYSEVSYDHKAFLLAKSKNLLAMPIGNYGKNGDYRQNAAIFSITADSIKYLEDISHYNDKATSTYSYGVSRIFYIGDLLYTLSDKELRCNNISDLKPVKTLKLN